MSTGKVFAPIHGPTSDETQALVLAARWVAVYGTAVKASRLNHFAGIQRIDPFEKTMPGRGE